MNHGIKIMFISHFVFWLGVNILAPFLSIFFIKELQNVTLTEVGISSLIYFLSFGATEPLFGFLSDKIKGFKDELVFVIFGYIARGIVLILLAFSTTVWHLYMIQLCLGLFRAVAGPANSVLFYKLMKRSKKGIFWGFDESIINIAAAIGAGLGGYLAQQYGFRQVILYAGILTVVSGLMNMFLIKDIRKLSED